MAISPEHLRRIKTNDLKDEFVRTALAGYLHQELRNIHGFVVAPDRLYDAITKYAVLAPNLMPTAADLLDSGMRPRNWPKDELL